MVGTRRAPRIRVGGDWQLAIGSLLTGGQGTPVVTDSHGRTPPAILPAMLRNLTRLVLVLALFVAACSEDPLLHADDALPGSIGSLAGGYVLNGIDPHGSEYTGRLDITGDPFSHTYELQWIVTEAFQQGTGTLNGNVLEVKWQTSEQAALTVAGTAEFTVTVEGELYGSKMVTGDDGEWRETAYPVGR